MMPSHALRQLGRHALVWPLIVLTTILFVALFAVGFVGSDLLRVLGLLIIAPVTEEIIFRGGLQESLLTRLKSRHTTNVLTAVAFALAHVLVRHDWAALIVLFPALLLGELYGRGRRLIPCILLHAGMNACWVLWAHWGHRELVGS